MHNTVMVESKMAATATMRQICDGSVSANVQGPNFTTAPIFVLYEKRNDSPRIWCIWTIFVNVFVFQLHVGKSVHSCENVFVLDDTKKHKIYEILLSLSNKSNNYSNRVV